MEPEVAQVFLHLMREDVATETNATAADVAKKHHALAGIPDSDDSSPE